MSTDPLAAEDPSVTPEDLNEEDKVMLVFSPFRTGASLAWPCAQRSVCAYPSSASATASKESEAASHLAGS